MNQRGLSGIITQLMTIVLVFVAVGFLMSVINSVVRGGSDQVSLGKLTVDVVIENVQDNGDLVNVQVERKVGSGDLYGLRFALNDGGATTEIIDKKNIGLEEMELQTFDLNYSNLVKKITIAPIFLSESGKEYIGKETDRMEFSNKDVIESIGGVAWWKFDGDVKDEFGNSDGTISGTVDCDVTGQYGEACYFDGNGGFIDTSKARSTFFNETDGTIMAWVKPEASVSAGDFISLPSVIEDNGGKAGIYVGDPAGLGNYIWIYNDDSTPIFWTNVSYTLDSWTHITWVHTAGNIYAYKNGNQVSFSASNDTDGDFGIEMGTNDFNGTIDELIIFNRGLSDVEISALASLDLK